MNDCTVYDVAKMIDHSLLNPTYTKEQVVEGCLLAKKYDVATVCVKPCDVEASMEVLRGSDVLVTTVIGFPHGSNLTIVKEYEAKIALEQGCKELDMVMNIGRFLGGEYDYVKQDIKAVAEITHGHGAILKVILENAYLTPEQITAACKISEEAGADFVKTSTGYAPTGATISDLKNMRASVSSRIKVKAAGGIRTLESALTLRSIGVSRFGCTVTEKMLEEAKEREKLNELHLQYFKKSQ